MKIPRISEIDLARISVLQFDEKKRALRTLRFGRPPHTYNPMRKSLPDILNLQPELFVDGSQRTSFEQIESDIRSRSKSTDEAEFNLKVAECLYDFCESNDVRSYSKPTLPWSVGFGQVVKYWWSLYAVFEERAVFIFPDPRLTKPLTRLATNFVHSMMHERLRAGEPDFSDARLCVAKFDRGDKGNRVLRLVDANETQLFETKALNQMIDETYRLWIEVLNERTEEQQQRPTGTNPMGF